VDRVKGRTFADFAGVALPLQHRPLPARALFLPGISEHERAVLDTYYKQKFGWSIDEHASRLTEQATAPMPWWDNGQLSYWPLWWQSPRSAASFA
jgi:hypothetical protein